MVPCTVSKTGFSNRILENPLWCRPPIPCWKIKKNDNVWLVLLFCSSVVLYSLCWVSNRILGNSLWPSSLYCLKTGFSNRILENPLWCRQKMIHVDKKQMSLSLWSFYHNVTMFCQNTETNMFYVTKSYIKSTPSSGDMSWTKSSGGHQCLQIKGTRVLHILQ